MNTQFIDKLVSKNKGWGRIHSPAVVTAICTVVAFSALTLIMSNTWGGLRANATEQLLTHPRFLLEYTSLVLLAVFSLFLASGLAIPGSLIESNSKIAKTIFVTLFSISVLLMLYSLADSALPASMAGKRLHCFLEILCYGLSAQVAIFYLVLRKRALFQKKWIGFTASLGAGLVPMSLMQVGCMYDPLHNIGYHLAPLLLASIIGAIFISWQAKSI